MWQCPICSREFSRKNQRHACGTGDKDHVLRDRPESVIETYLEIEKFVNELGTVEVVARNRYALFRSTRIFTDLTIMKDVVRVALHLNRKVEAPIFIKIVDEGKK